MFRVSEWFVPSVDPVFGMRIKTLYGSPVSVHEISTEDKTGDPIEGKTFRL